MLLFIHSTSLLGRRLLYYESIIRDEIILEKIREYVLNNPLSWEQDQLHPDNPSKW